MSLAVIPEMIRNIHDNHTVLNHAMTTGVDDLSTLHTGTGYIGDNILAITVDNTVVVSAICRMDDNAVAGVIRNTIIREQSIQIANNTGNTSDTDIGLVVEFQNGQSADSFIAAEVPAVVAACSEHAVGVAGVIEQRLAVTGKVHMVSIGVPVTGEVLDRLPAFRQSQVVNNLIAAVQRIPERTTSLQSRQNLHVVDRTHANNEVAVFLTVLICCTNLALLALRDVHDSVGKQSRFTLRSGVLGQVTNLVHQEVAGAGEVEVAGAVPRTTRCRVGNGLGGGVRVITELCTGDITACVIDPDRTERNLRVGVSTRCTEIRRNIVREVRGVTILDCGLCLRVGIRLQTNTQLVAAVHDASFTVGAVATTSRQNHGDSIGRQDSAGIDVTAVSAHQSVHVPVTVVNVRNRVQDIVAGRPIILIGTETTTLVVITRTGVGITSNVGIIPRTGIGVHGIVTDTHAVALAQETLDGVVGFAGKVWLLLYANTPADRVDAVVALGVNHVHLRVGVKLLNLY